jgi:putative aldouronate transport system permease protein
VQTTSVNKLPILTAAKSNSFIRYFRRNLWLYIFLIPGFLYLLIFKYVPMGGLVIAFKDLSLTKGIWDSDWVGLYHFQNLFESSNFYRILRNSLVISLYQIVWGFPAPIILALMLNEVRHLMFKRLSQTILYLPHFISWVVMAGLVMNFLSPSTGILNYALNALGFDSVAFLLKAEYFRTILVSSEIWKEIGWGTIIYFAAISGIDPTLYESATIDGANRFQKMWHITLPGIVATIVILFLLQLGNILDNGFEQIYLLYNPTTYATGDVFETYTFRIGLQQGRISYGTAVGLFKALVGFVLVLTANRMARKISGKSIW